MKKLLFGWCAALLLLAGQLAAQPISEQPLLNVRLPLFNAAGARLWDLESAALRTLSLDRFALTTVHVRMFAGDAANTLEGELFAPTALVDLKARTIAGEGQLHVIGRGVELFGNDWIYDATAKSIVIKADVVVTFAGDFGNILR